MLTSISVISYTAAALAYLVLFGLSLTSWRGRTPGKLLALACLTSALWSGAVAYYAAHGYQSTLGSDLLEVLRNGIWTFFLLTLLGPFRQVEGRSFMSVRPVTVILAGFYLFLLLGLVYSYYNFYAVSGFPLGTMGFLTGIVGRVMMAIIGIALVEQIYRNAPPNERWGIVFLCLGVGGAFAYDFYLYSEAMVFGRVDVGLWNARGVVNVLVVPLVAISATRDPNWSLNLSISRQVILSSTALFGAGVYLLAMAATGYYIRNFGGNWGTVLQVAFFFGALVLLFLVWFSRRLRSWLRVFISKHFFSYNYDYREEWLRFTRTLSDGRHGLGERTIQAVADLVESPGGALWVSKESGNCEFLVHWNMPMASGAEPLNSAFCHFLESKHWVIDLQDYSLHPERYAKLVIPQWLNAIPKASLVIPLIHYGRLFGFVVLAQPRSRIKLNWEVNDLLKIAGCQAASHLAQQEADNSLLVARQFASFNRMSTFVVHDLKNLVTQLALLLSNADAHKSKPEFQKDMVETLEHSVNKMTGLLEKINECSLKLRSGEPMNEEHTSLPMDKLLQHAVVAHSASKPKPALEILDGTLEVHANWTRLERVIGHLIQNAIEATPKDGQVLVRLSRQEDTAIIEVKDTGHGMSEEFIRERLFKPFDSTKAAGMGIGVFEIREYVRELEGQLEVASQPSNGTTFRVILPLHFQDQTVAQPA
ncbi:periplasmic sensor signal transduction histidine kinase [Sulfuricella denitrificans skB26]|uniref:histidine kinase n=1 Tax=Sulfuricella denitrificans (strain DSM 22764 / NBRC 105220 / skB26) TaxID=1163617 RepID=S6AKJ5_SULDS|nr:XrtA/PEP-CTERM system histidine kinase PrsK [Sulfuricella denitrificans]BAN35124.1 periplasmic sensor signal transduction histidine kinase [Sulfuricella denitrificans skB26]